MDNDVVGDSSAREVLSLVAIVGFIIGLLMCRSANGGFDNVLLLSVIASFAIGLIQSLRTPCPPRFSFKASAIGAGALLAAFLLYAITRGILDGKSLFVIFFSLNMSGRENPQALIVVGIVSFVITLLLGFLVAQGARPIIKGAQSLFSFGAEGVTRVNKLLAAIIAVVATVVAFWATYK